MTLWQWHTPGWCFEDVTAPPTVEPDDRCHYCGGPNVWARDRNGWAPFRMCHECLQPAYCYGVEEIEVPGEVIDLAKSQIPTRYADRRSDPGNNPQWEVKGGQLIVRPTTLRLRLYGESC